MTRIKELRTAAKITQQELADYLQVSRAALSGYETEKFMADLDTYIKIANYFNVSLDYLLGNTGEKSPAPKSEASTRELLETLSEEQLIDLIAQASDLLVKLKDAKI